MYQGKRLPLHKYNLPGRECLDHMMDKMKRYLFLLIACCLFVPARTQETNEGSEKDRNVYLEILGGSSLVGINYDARFHDHTRWGWRAGLSWAFTNRVGFMNVYNDDLRYWAVPVGVNYLAGNQKNNLELGIGASLGMANLHYTDFDADGKSRSKDTFGYFFFGDVGYRHVARSGFLFRVGLSPTFNFGGEHAIGRSFSDTFHHLNLGGYLAFGWNF